MIRSEETTLALAIRLLQTMTQVVTNPRGIPQAPFVEVVEDFIKSSPVDVVMAKFEETLYMYKKMELGVSQRRGALLSKIPELEKSLNAVVYLSERNTFETYFELNETLMAYGKVKDAQSAGVMVEYSIAEAQQLLTEKLELGRKSLGNVQQDLEYLREQITTIQVNIARVHNWTVQQRRLHK